MECAAREQSRSFSPNIYYTSIMEKRESRVFKLSQFVHLVSASEVLVLKGKIIAEQKGTFSAQQTHSILAQKMRYYVN